MSAPSLCPFCRAMCEPTNDGSRCVPCGRRWVIATVIQTSRVRHFMVARLGRRVVLCDPAIVSSYTDSRPLVTCKACLAGMKRKPGTYGTKVRAICLSCQFWRGITAFQGHCYIQKRLTGHEHTCGAYEV